MPEISSELIGSELSGRPVSVPRPVQVPPWVALIDVPRFWLAAFTAGALGALIKTAGMAPDCCRAETWLCKVATCCCSACICDASDESEDRKSTRLNSSHVEISYAVFC